jgi:ABC-type transport system substrate-binding protein
MAPAFGPIPAYSWAYSKRVEAVADPAVARALLEDAGWGFGVEAARLNEGSAVRLQGARPLRLPLLVPADGRLIGLAEGLQMQLLAVGIQIELQPMDELDLFRERLRLRKFDLALLDIQLGTVDADPYPLWHSGGAAEGFNFASYRNEEADRFLWAARLEGDPTPRRAALEGFQGLWATDVPSIVLANPLMTYAVEDRIRGVRLGVVPHPSARFQHLADWYVRTQRMPALLG